LFISLAALAQTPEKRAIAYLSVEVPRWSRENGCFSCHNNGDAARALFMAKGHMHPALADTLDWLSRPAAWEENKGSPAFSDKKLARLQFAATLTQSGWDSHALFEVAEQVAQDQEPDGSWVVDASNPAGSPVTWGTALATLITWQMMERTGNREAAQKAYEWINRLQPKNVPEAAVKLMMMSFDGAAINLLLEAQSARDGGWGPIRGAPSEAFDTALAMMALSRRRILGNISRIKRGRKFLIATQLREGGWPATTRPTGGQSYAQHISTTAWALMALMQTANLKMPPARR